MMLRKFAAAAAVACVTLSTFATTRYVDYAKGTDSGDGTAAPGWKTLAYAVATADSEDEIILAKGTHEINEAITIGKKLHIHGAGENSETTLDALNKQRLIKITIAGAVLNNFTVYRLGEGASQSMGMEMSGNSVISNVVFTKCGGATANNSRFLLTAKAGTVANCWITNNVMGTGGHLYLTGGATAENCVIRDNKVSASATQSWFGKGIVQVAHKDAIVRNCTIVDNKLKVYAAVYASAAAKIYNNLIWNNTAVDTGADANWVLSAATVSTANWLRNCTTPAAGLPEDNIFEDPQLTDGLHFASSSPLNHKAKTGTDAAGVAYATAFDVDGASRGDAPSVGAFEYQAPPEMALTVAASSKWVRQPDVITLTCSVEGVYETPLSYVWTAEGSDEVLSVDASFELSKAGVVRNPKVTVTDAAGQVKSATLDGDYAIHTEGAATYYVDYAKGSDRYDGMTEEKPWKSVSAAMNQSLLVEGDEIVLKRGTHALDGPILLSKAITLRGEGENWETVLDGNNGQRYLRITADDAVVHSLTLYRNANNYTVPQSIDMSGDSIVSNVVVWGNCNAYASQASYGSGRPVYASAGLLTHCWVTNNSAFRCAGVALDGSATMENCCIAGNNNRGNASLNEGIVCLLSSSAVLRNCTIVDNTVNDSGAVVDKAGAGVYNNLIWGHATGGTDRNWAVADGVSTAGWICNCTTGSEAFEGFGNTSSDPQLLADRRHFASRSPCRGKADAVRAPAFDLDCNPRGDSPSIGAFEYVSSGAGLEIAAINASASFSRQPAGVTFSCALEGDYLEPLEYAWDLDGDGDVDSTEAEPTVAEIGYWQPTLTVRDANGATDTQTMTGRAYVHAAGAMTFYVDGENGDDGNTGIEASAAWKNLDVAIGQTAVADDDEILIVRGTNVLTKAITLEKRITVRGEDREGTVLDGKSSTGNLTISANGAVLRDLTLYRVGGANDEGLSIRLNGNSIVSNVVMTGIDFRGKVGNARGVVSAQAGLVTHCFITNNAAFGNSGLILSDSAVVEDCLIAGNEQLGGLYYASHVDLSGGATVRNCTIVNNTTLPGAATLFSKSSAAKVYNNIVWGNTADWSTASEVTTAKWKNNCTTRIAELPEGNGNIEADPLFVGGNPLEIPVKSPCRNKGDKALGSAASVDILGNPRIKGGKIDIGCVECQLGLGLGILVR